MDVPGGCRIPSATATAAGTSAGSRTAASSTSHAPSANRPATRRATSPASRVFPYPSRPSHRHQPVLIQQPGDLIDLTRPADKSRQRRPEAIQARYRNACRIPHGITISAASGRA